MEYQHCGMMAGRISELCEPLQTLKNEHGPLTAQMEQLYQSSNLIGNNPSIDNWVEQINALKEDVVTFVQHLEPHSEREEGILFPMMAAYIGREMGPIAVMEYEHDQAKSHLGTFLEKTDNLNTEVKANEAKDLADLVIQAYFILKEHFSKEENVLFPMAEQMLSDEEKEELRRKVMTV
ncbi:hemerythrin-like domain-containing protein [Bacillus fengqiuensis]|nr:hemerythrin-like domain-containing protein [Bacillus fengqiuensis]